MPVLAVLTLADVIEGVKGMASQEHVTAMEEYIKQYGSSA